jgi:Fe(3+) dicitrate transport protein
VAPRTRASALTAILAFLPLRAFAQDADDTGQKSAPETAEVEIAALPAPVAASDAPRAAAPAAKPEAPVDITILGTRVARTPGSAHVIRSRELERFNYDDPNATLQSVPGVYVRGEDGVGLRPNIGLRGVNPDRSKKVTLMEDGILFGPAPYSAPAAYYFPIITRMSQVRVVKGPGALIYGPQTVAGAVDLITRNPPSSPSGEIDAAVGDYGYNKIHGYFGSSDDHTGFLIEGVHLGSEGFKELPNGGDTGFHRNEWMFKGFATLPSGSASKHEIWLKATYSDEISNETYLGLTDADFRAHPLRRYAASQLDRMRNHRTSFALTHKIEPTSKLSLSTTLYRHDFFRIWRKVNRFRGASLFDVIKDPDSPDTAAYAGILRGTLDSTTGNEAIMIGPNQREFVSQGLDFKASAKASTGPLEHRIEYGIRLHQDRIERLHSEDAFQMIGGELIPEGSPTTVTAANEDVSEALALHLVDAVTWGRLTVTPGLRVEVIHSKSTDDLDGAEGSRLLKVALPGVGAYYAITEDFGALAGVYRGFSPSVPSTEGFDDGQHDPEPEFSVNYEGGVRLSSEKLRAEAIGFFNDYSNLTDICTLSSGCLDQDLDRQFDAGRAHVYGVEAFVAHELPIGKAITLPLSLAYTLTYAEFANSFESWDPINQPDPSVRPSGQVEAGDEMPYVPRHQLRAALGVETARFGLNGGLTYVSEMREQPGPGDISTSLHTDSQFVLDVGASARVLSPLTLYANVRNLLDSHDIVARRPYGARPNAPRWVLACAKVTF